MVFFRTTIFSMLSISTQQLEQLIADCKVLEKDGFGPKVLESSDGLIIYKLFRRKRWFSSALLRPYAKRFVDNAKKLEARGFRTTTIRELSYCKQSAFHLVVYDKVPGVSLRDYLKSEAEHSGAQVFALLGAMIARLHSNGVYFRSLHLGNLLWDLGGDFPLIDIADMRFYRHSLTPGQRVRNFRPLLKRTTDHSLIDHESWALIVEHYLNNVDISSDQAAQLSPKLMALAEGLTTD